MTRERNVEALVLRLLSNLDLIKQRRTRQDIKEGKHRAMAGRLVRVL